MPPHVHKTYRSRMQMKHLDPWLLRPQSLPATFVNPSHFHLLGITVFVDLLVRRVLYM